MLNSSTIQSKVEKPIKQFPFFSSYDNATTKNETIENSSRGQSNGQLTHDLSSLKSQKILILQSKINKIRKAQQQLQKKFSKVLQNLSYEIQQKDDANLKLQKQIQFLQGSLNESKNDMQIIKKFLKKQELKQNSDLINRKKAIFNQTVTKISKLAIPNHIFTDITMQSIVASRKSISPRAKLVKKQIKG